MVLGNIKENINRIDFELKKLFENVYISENANKDKYYFDICVNSLFLIEGFKKRVEVKISILKNDLNSNNIKWSYSLNPLNENAERIDRVSNIQNISNDIYDVAFNKRMLKEYFDTLEVYVDLIKG